MRETSDDKTDHARHYSLHSILGTVINVPESIVQHRQFVLEQYHSEAAGIDEAIRFIDGIFSRSPRSIIARNSRQSVPTKRAKSKAKKPSKKKRKQNGKGASMGRAEM